jgi:hypothetical protein
MRRTCVRDTFITCATADKFSSIGFRVDGEVVALAERRQIERVRTDINRAIRIQSVVVSQLESAAADDRIQIGDGVLLLFISVPPDKKPVSSAKAGRALSH